MVDVRDTTAHTGPELDEKSVHEFRATLRGPLLRPGDDGYDSVRKIWNGMIDRRPALIARCTGVADVINCVNFARDNSLQVAVRCGGHSVAGNSVCDGGLMIDLSLMKGIRVDAKKRTASAQGGVLWGELDRETQALGLATVGGTISHTGIAGLTLGGGLGWLSGKHGLTCDNLLSADVVTSDGRFLTASASDNADLYWGLRGGSGNFGIVTSFEYQLHTVGPIVMGGIAFWPRENAKDVLHFYRDFAASAPEELTSAALLLHSPEGQPLVGIIAFFAGDMSAGERAVGPVKKFGPPAVDMIGPIPYTQHQSMLDAGLPHGMHRYWKSHYVNELSDGAIDTMLEYAEKVTSPLTAIAAFHMIHGAASRVKPADTAFGHRQASFEFSIVSQWTDPMETEKHVRWTREFWSAMEPHASGGVYVNHLSIDESERVRAAYGENYGRLAALKKKYDPTNLFRLNHNIKPTA